MIHLGTRELKTDRLILRRLTLDDAEDFCRVWSSGSIAWEPPYSTAQIQLLQKRIDKYRQPNVYDWGIVPLSTGRVVGEIFTVNHDERTASCEMVYGIARPYRNQGYASGALARVLRFLLLDAGYNRVQAGHLADNPASGRVMQKAGMQYEGRLRQDNRNAAGVLTDSIIYSMIRSDLDASSR